MKKGFLATLLAGTVAFGATTPAFALAPVIGNLPDVTVGDAEPADNPGGSDANYFVFTNAFQFSTNVSDGDTPDLNLLWSFAEGNASAPPHTQRYTINGVGPIADNDAEIATEAGNGFPTAKAPNALRINASSDFATFRDILFSPTPGTGPYPSPSLASAAIARDGKPVTLYVADPEGNLDSDIIMVNTDDGGLDAISANDPFIVELQDTDLGTWNKSGQDSGPENFFDPSSPDDVDITSSTGVLNAIVRASPANGGRQKILGWSRFNVLPADNVGPNKWIRSKWYIYANRPFTDNLNTVSGFRVRLQNEGAILGGMNYEYAQTGHGASYEPIYGLFNNPAIEASAGQYLRPANGSTKPSLYRADLDPVDVPALAGTGVGAVFESFSFVAPSDCVLTLTEFVVGTYTKRDTAAGVLKFEYDRVVGIGGGVGGPKNAAFAGFNHENSIEAGRRQDLKYPGLDPADPYSAALVATGAATTGPAGGLTIDTANSPANVFGIGVISLLSADPAQRPRLVKDKLYHTRFYVTSPTPTTSTNANATILGQVNLKVQTARSLATAYLYFNGPANASDSGPNKAIISQSAPGQGSVNPETEVALGTAGEAGGWYNVIMSSPWHTDIRQDGVSYGTLASDPAQGQPGDSGKDIIVGLDAIETPTTLKFGPTAPFNNFPYSQPNRVNVRISKIQIFEHNDVDDGGYGY